jgi:hypothetical protein
VLITRLAPEDATAAGSGAWGYSGDNGPAINAQLEFPTGVAVDYAGNLYIAGLGNSRIREVSAKGIITTRKSMHATTRRKRL